MLNQTVIVGRLVAEPEIKELEDGKKVSNITVAVQRSYKNADGEYATDFIDCTLWSGIAENTALYCKKGDVLGIKGRVETDTYEKDGHTHKVQKVIAEKVTFLSSSKVNENENVEDVTPKAEPKKNKKKDKEVEM